MAIQSPLYWYLDSVSYAAIPTWTAAHAYTVGTIVRQVSPTAGNERCFICIVAGNSHATTEPTWTLTKGAKTTDNTVTWQECTGRTALNGSNTKTPPWPSNTNPGLGYIIKNTANTHYFICSTAGTTTNGTEPTWNTTTGATTADNAATWTCLGAKGSFTTAFAAPFARATSVFQTGFAVAGDWVWIGDDHAETQAASSTITLTGSSATAPTLGICVDHTKADFTSADLKTTASIATTGANNLTIGSASAGYVYFYGMQFLCCDGASSATLTLSGIAGTGLLRFEKCTFNLRGTGASTLGLINNGTTSVELLGCTLTFSATNQNFTMTGGGNVYIRDGSIGGSAVPTTLINNTLGGGKLEMDCVDLTAFGSGKTLVGALGSDTELTFRNCPLGASVTKVATQTSVNSPRVNFINCDSGATGYIQDRTDRGGSLVAETTVVRTGGATDGVQSISWKITTRSFQSERVSPFMSHEMLVWNTQTGSPLTVTMELLTDNVTLTNADAWLEVRYMGSSSNPGGSLVSTGLADLLAAASNLTSSAAAWTTTGIGTPVTQKISATFTPQMIGFYRVVLKVGKASATVYADPKLSDGVNTQNRQMIAVANEYLDSVYTPGGMLVHPAMAGGMRG